MIHVQGIIVACLVGLLPLGCGRPADRAAPGGPPALEAKALADQASVVAGNTQFAVDLYHQLRTQDGNLFVSPYSLTTALAMAYVGARGETALQMAKTLRFPVEPARLHPAFASLIQQTIGPGKEKGYELNVANRLWGQRGYGFSPEGLAEINKYYGAGFEETDFAGNPEQAKVAINAWGSEQTRGKIPQVLDAINPETVLILANAIYFKGDWVFLL